MKKSILFALILLSSPGLEGYAQINYSLKVEAGYLKYQNNTLQVDPGPNWKGYYIEGENGVDFNIVNGINYNNTIFVGVGIGYLNFEGVNGLSLFSDVEYLPLNTRISPAIGIKVGYSHIWNQYENGSGTALAELGIGINFRLTDSIDIFAKSGFLVTQQSFLIPIRLGFRF